MINWPLSAALPLARLLAKGLPVLVGLVVIDPK